ncbi:hypothetical protein HKD24_12670 [Gluconobacter sp. LMG 31484]|uniref:Glycosyl transferase family 2 n=1 Tax=Gluconobacter vitians TaxID=2728102 RepID=A0ABR9Y893_9PROT|nr:hypothetical protein [Gluconobacter vitians]MBF0860060.1 hypothetical protein [Gluconobacter vitians]
MKTAIIFKTHIWDNIVERNFLLCKENSKNSDIFIIFDPVLGRPLPEKYQKEEKVFLVPYSDIEKLGLEYGMDERRGGYWYNGDYHQNLFILSHPEYDYICSVENDVATHLSIDDIFSQMAAKNVDVIYHPQTQPNEQWSHLEGSIGYTDTSEYIHKGLFCVSFFSRRAAFYILRRRMEMSHLKREKGLSTWPIGETVMVHEPVQAGMNVDLLINYCDHLQMYDWAPCYLECEEISAEGRTFIHPVTNLNNKFIISNFYQDYHAMFSEMEVIEGKSRHRARIINDLEIYSRLFNSVHAQWSPDRWEPILQDAETYLNKDGKEILGGKNILGSENIMIPAAQNPHHIDKIFTSALPNWDQRYAVSLQPDEIMHVVIPEQAQCLTAIIGTTQDNILENMRAVRSDNENLEIEYRKSWRGMHFFSVNIPSGTNAFCIKALSFSLDLYSLRVISNDDFT